MRIAVVKEIKPQERRVGLTPAGVAELVHHGHDVLVERGAGEGAGFSDGDYAEAGATLTGQDEAWTQAELMVKVKEPIAEEYGFLREDLTLFTYLHLAADRPLTEALLASKTLAIAYETVQDAEGLPLLTPMSEIAGRLAAHAAAHYLTATAGGPGMLIGGAPGIPAARILVIGGGVVGTQAAQVALGMGAEVTVLDASVRRVRQLDAIFAGRARVLTSSRQVVDRELRGANAVIGAVLVPGGAAPKVVSREQLALLEPGTLLVDVAIDQGGAFETSHPTTYEDPIYEVDSVRHYCVANMPGAVPRTSTLALSNATFPFVLSMAERGVDAAISADPVLARGVNTREGRIEFAGVAEAFPDLA